MYNRTWDDITIWFRISLDGDEVELLKHASCYILSRSFIAHLEETLFFRLVFFSKDRRRSGAAVKFESYKMINFCKSSGKIIIFYFFSSVEVVIWVKKHMASLQFELLRLKRRRNIFTHLHTGCSSHGACLQTKDVAIQTT